MLALKVEADPNFFPLEIWKNLFGQHVEEDVNPLPPHEFEVICFEVMVPALDVIIGLDLVVRFTLIRKQGQQAIEDIDQDEPFSKQ